MKRIIVDENKRNVLAIKCLINCSFSHFKQSNSIFTYFVIIYKVYLNMFTEFVRLVVCLLLHTIDGGSALLCIETWLQSLIHSMILFILIDSVVVTGNCVQQSYFASSCFQLNVSHFVCCWCCFFFTSLSCHCWQFFLLSNQLGGQYCKLLSLTNMMWTAIFSFALSLTHTSAIKNHFFLVDLSSLKDIELHATISVLLACQYLSTPFKVIPFICLQSIHLLVSLCFHLLLQHKYTENYCTNMKCVNRIANEKRYCRLLLVVYCVGYIIHFVYHYYYYNFFFLLNFHIYLLGCISIWHIQRIKWEKKPEEVEWRWWCGNACSDTLQTSQIK